MNVQVDTAAKGWSAGVLLLLGLVGCGGYETAYERAVYDAEPVSCYRTIADPDCYRVADPASNRRLVNYYGPSPRRTEALPTADIRLDPPPPVEADHAVDDAVERGTQPGAEVMGERAQPPMPQAVAASANAPRLGGEGPGDGR